MFPLFIYPYVSKQVMRKNVCVIVAPIFMNIHKTNAKIWFIMFEEYVHMFNAVKYNII